MQRVYAVLDIVKDILSNMHKRYFSCGVFTDLQYCAKVMRTNFDKFLGFSWLFKEMSPQTKVPRLFRELSRYLLFYSS